MAKRILFVVQSATVRINPLKGANGRRLAALAGLDIIEFLKRFDRVTLSPDLAEARKQIDELREHWQGRRALLLGRGVAVAFRLAEDDFEPFKPLEVPPGLEVAVMPHTAGINNWWKTPAIAGAARDYLLRLNILETDTRQKGSDRFTEAEVAAALVAGRGIHTWAARALAEETGLSCTSQTIANYVAKYPRLAEIPNQMRSQMLDFAEHNVVRSIEDGDMDTTRWLLRSQMANGRGYALQVNGKVHVSGQVEHRHAHLHARLNGAGLDLSQYSADQLKAIEDFAGALGAEPDKPE